MPVNRLCISADSHVVESAEFFKPLVEMFGDRSPRVVTLDPALGPRLDIGNGTFTISVSEFLQQNIDFKSSQGQESLRLGYDLARPGCYDTSERLKDQDFDGIDAEVIYPSLLFGVYQIDDLDIVKATFGLYNDWVGNYCKEQPNRLFALGGVQLFDLDEAIKEMERCKNMGHVGVCIPATAPPDRLYSDPWYDKFWAAAQEMKMSLNMHIFTGATPNHGLPPAMKSSGYALASCGVMFTCADIIQSGVCERFPDIKFVVTEFETGWIANMLKRLDWGFVRGGGAKTQSIPMKPSEYWRRNFRATFEDDDLGIMTREYIGTNTLMWGNDYPHGDSIFPHSQRVLTDLLADCTPDERYEMTVKNVVELYDLPFVLEGPGQARLNQKSVST